MFVTRIVPVGEQFDYVSKFLLLLSHAHREPPRFFGSASDNNGLYYVREHLRSAAFSVHPPVPVSLLSHPSRTVANTSTRLHSPI